MFEKPVEDHIAHLNERIDFYAVQSKSNWWAHNFSRMGVIVIAAAIPFATTLDAGNVWVSFLGFSVAALSGIDGFKRFGEKWQTFRIAQVSLQNQIRSFNYSISLMPQDDRKLSNETYRKRFEELVRHSEATIRDESETFWSIAEVGQPEATDDK